MSEVHHAVGDAFSAYGGAAWAGARRGGPAAHRRGRGDRVRQPARQRGAGPPGRPAGRGDGGERGRLAPHPTTRAVPGDPAGGRRGGAGGDAARRPAGRVQRGRARRRGRPGGPPGPATVHEFSPEVAAADLVARVASTEPGEPDRSGSLRSARVVVGAGRGAGGTDGFDAGHRAGRAAGRRARRVPGGDQPRLAPAPRAGRPDRQPDLPGAVHPVRDLRGHPALGRLRQLQDDPGHQHRSGRARWCPRRPTR